MMKKKVLLTTLSFLAATFSAAGLAACEEDPAPAPTGTLKLQGFEVAKETDTAELGGVYIAENLLPHDTNGTFYDVELSVEKDGSPVTVIGNAFDLAETGDYKITYSLTFKGEEQKKTTVVTVNDTVAPFVNFEALTTKVTVGDSVDLSGIFASDWSGVSTIVKTVTAGTKTVEVKDDKFTAAEDGVYAVTVTATDTKGNSDDYTHYVNSMVKGGLYNFEMDFASAEFWNAASLSRAVTLPAGNDTAGLRVTFENAWQELYFRDLTADFFKANKAEYSSIKFDVYIEGQELPDSGYAWITPFGASPQAMKSGEWKTFTVPLDQCTKNAIAFNLDVTGENPRHLKDYVVYMDNIRMVEAPKDNAEHLYNGFESMSGDAWKYVSYFYTGAADSAEMKSEGEKSLKLTPTATWAFFKLCDGTSGTLLDNAWIKARKGKTLTFKVYYQNAAKPTSTINFNVGADTDHTTVNTLNQGQWYTITLDFDDMQTWGEIVMVLNGEDAIGGAVYLDDFKIAEKTAQNA